MLRRSLQNFGSRLLEQQPALMQRIGMAARGGQSGAVRVWRRSLSQYSGPSATASGLARAARSSPFSFPRVLRRTFHSSKARRSHKDGAAGGGSGAGASAAAQPLSLSARLKKLSREYGWAAVGVYLGLSLLDFPFCFLLVRTVGTDRIAVAEHYVVSHVEAVIPESIKEYWRTYRSALKEAKKESDNGNAADETDVEGWGVEEADKELQKKASLATQLALAYAIHKSFIFVRVPLTAAVTPKVVKVLRSWGWKIGKKTT